MRVNAELGGSPALLSSESKQATTVQTYQTRSKAPYTLHLTTFDAGVTVKEYVSQSGNVFAVAWIEQKSVAAPVNLLLGAYFSCYQQAINAARMENGALPTALNIEQSGLSIRIGHDMDRTSGSVYLRQALPVGLEEGAIN